MPARVSVYNRKLLLQCLFPVVKARTTPGNWSFNTPRGACNDVQNSLRLSDSNARVTSACTCWPTMSRGPPTAHQLDKPFDSGSRHQTLSGKGKDTLRGPRIPASLSASAADVFLQTFVAGATSNWHAGGPLPPGQSPGFPKGGWTLCIKHHHVHTKRWCQMLTPVTRNSAASPPQDGPELQHSRNFLQRRRCPIAENPDLGRRPVHLPILVKELRRHWDVRQKFISVGDQLIGCGRCRSLQQRARLCHQTGRASQPAVGQSTGGKDCTVS